MLQNIAKLNMHTKFRTLYLAAPHPEVVNVGKIVLLVSGLLPLRVHLALFLGAFSILILRLLEIKVTEICE